MYIKTCGISNNQLLRTNFRRRSNFVVHTGRQKDFPRLITSSAPSSSYVLPSIAFPQIPFQKSSHFIHISICNDRCRQWFGLTDTGQIILQDETQEPQAPTSWYP